MEKTLLKIGMISTPWWLISIGIFGALQPGYSHLYKAVSELGALDAANPWGMNIFCLFLTGFFVTLSGFAFKKYLVSRNLSSTSAWWLIVFGIMLAGTAVPADMERYFENPLTVIHAFFALFGVVPFLVAAWLTPRVLRRQGTHSAFLTWFPWLIVPTFFMHGVVEQSGLIQRITILITLVWVSYLSYFLIKSKSA